MAKDLHKGIQLDDKFNKAMKRVQDAIETFEQLADDYRDYEVKPVSSQLHGLDTAASDLLKVSRMLAALKAK